ncbi:4-phosphopantetheinyl transferase [Candidatus Woesearchaeota archaeon B3_Woes]|nr:MAG: 4-phosphopantetheinyl transferase [Candidatus Woesearchaeota archaeon B3_Woes]
MNIVGIDIEDISRFKKIPFDRNKSFYNKIFTNKEIEYCKKKSNPSQHFAVRFCAKEAFIKAINEKINDYKLIEVLIKGNKPFIKWKNVNSSLSLSHDKDKAIACVLIEKN